jgi:pyruvate/2-oxoglutarate dehydrogenase complex dihydrolipoamide dehydrogenase (E3) component
MNRQYDAIVIGAGQAGPSLAARFAGAGQSVAIIERHLFGGTCVNSETRGLMKVLVDARSNLILGASILGVGADESIHSIIDVMAARLPYTTLRNTVHIHPTVSELIPTVLGELGPPTGMSI